MGAPRSTPALRLAAFDSTLAATLAQDRAERAVGLRLLTLYGTPFRGRDSLRREVPPSDEPARAALQVCRPRHWTARRGSRSAPTGRGRSTAARRSLSTRAPAAGAVPGPQPRQPGQHPVHRTCWVGGSTSTWTSTPSGNTPATTTSRSTTRGCRTRSSAGWMSVRSLFQPPPSRFITAAVPANNFGVNAIFEFGPIQLQTLAATQKGSVVAERTYTIGQTTSQAQDRQARDLDFEGGRFFWVVDPDSVPGYSRGRHPEPRSQPSIPATYRPTEVRLYRYRAARGNSGVNPNLGGITAIARRGGQRPDRWRRCSWELLIQGTRLLPGPLRALDRPGHQAGPERLPRRQLPDRGGHDDRHLSRGGPGRRLDRLPGAHRPSRSRRPTSRTFRYEMRQVYRVAGADLDASSLAGGHHASTARSGRSRARRRPTCSSSASPLPSDPTLFDRENRLLPRARDPEAATQVVKRPPTSSSPTSSRSPTRPSSRPAEISDSLYRTPVYLLLTEGPPAKFALRLRYDASGRRRPLDASTSTPSRSARGASSSTSAAGSWSGTWTTGSPTTSARSPSSIPTLLFGQGSAQVHGALRGARDLRGGADHDPGHVHPLFAGRAGRDQPDRAVSAGAERLHPPGARLRGHAPT